MIKLEPVKKYDEYSIYESVARVIHDINSPIATIEMGLFLLSKEVQSDSLPIIKAALQRVRDITQNFSATHYANQRLQLVQESMKFSDERANHHQFMNIKLLIEDVLSEKRCEWAGNDYELSVSYESVENNLIINVDPLAFKRMLSNLLNNSYEACGGFVKIRLTLTIKEGGLSLAITDNGVGIPADKIVPCLIGKSSKHAGKGLGLSGAMATMKRLGGEIFIDSQVGNGTDIDLRFPMQSERKIEKNSA